MSRAQQELQAYLDGGYCTTPGSTGDARCCGVWSTPASRAATSRGHAAGNEPSSNVPVKSKQCLGVHWPLHSSLHALEASRPCVSSRLPNVGCGV
eukprot:scaffold127157_cov40-Attheya_sp.AAC.1